MTADFLQKVLSEDAPDITPFFKQEEFDGEMWPQFRGTFGTDEICPICGKEIAYSHLEFHAYQRPLLDYLAVFCDCGHT